MHREHFDNASVPVRVPRGNDGFWAIMRRLNAEQGHFTVADIDGESNVSISNISEYLKGLVAAGIAEQCGKRPPAAKGRFPTPLYRLLKQPIRAPRVREDGSLILPSHDEQLWTAIRTLKTFNVKELIFAATTDDVKPSLFSARHLLKILHGAGYLTVTSRGQRGNQVYRLKPNMNTGPLPPRSKQLNGRLVWDPNLGKFMGDAPIASEVKS